MPKSVLRRRLLAAGRAKEALKAVEAAEHSEDEDPAWRNFDWVGARIDALEALGRSDEAQELRCSVAKSGWLVTCLRDLEPGVEA